VTFITGSHYQKLVEGIGASFVPLSGHSDFSEADLDIRWPLRKTIEEGLPQFLHDLEHIFVDSMPSQYAAQQRALKMLNEQYPGRPIVAMSEASFMGSYVVMAKASGYLPTATLSLGFSAVVLSSIDCAPFGPGLPPDSSPAGRERNTAMNKELHEKVFGQVQKRFEEVMDSLGTALPEKPFFLNTAYMLSDRFLQMCVPSVEYPRSDAPSTIQFTGGVPKGYRDEFVDQPSWWLEVINNKSKKIVAVSQGSLALNFSDLIIPTMTALKDRDDILVVVALGKKGITLPADIAIPPNARVADFIPFDDLLPHCAVFVTNGGYGAFQHAISNGTPLVIGGATEDKPEVAMRAEWAGVGVNLRTGKPTPEALASAVDEVIGNPRYKKRALELEAEMAGYDPMGVVARSIDELGAGMHLK
jgi:UDP:flavonoid glycosyltransferase YjiC (YdhE family)